MLEIPETNGQWSRYVPPAIFEERVYKAEPSQANLLEDSKYEFLTESSLPNAQVNFCAISKDYILICPAAQANFELLLS